MREGQLHLEGKNNVANFRKTAAATNRTQNGTQTRGEIHERFRLIAQHVSIAAGSPWAAVLALSLVMVWGCAGPLFGYSDTWQLVINTSTTVITFIMVFIIQNSQNRDTRELQLKLDELLRAVEGARNEFIELEALPDEALDKLHSELETLVDQYGEVVSRTHRAVGLELKERHKRHEAS